MSILRALKGIPPGAVEIITALVGLIIELIRAGGNDAAQEEALMTAQEEIKRQLDKRKFGG